MPRIRIEPDRLRDVMRHWDRAAHDMEHIRHKIRRARRILDYQVLVSLKNPHLVTVIEQSHRKARLLASQCEDLSHQLGKIASRFEEADQAMNIYDRKVYPQPYFPDHRTGGNLLENNEIIAIGDHWCNPDHLNQSDLSWTPEFNYTTYENLSAEEIQDLNPKFSEWFPELLGHLGHLALMILEISAKHVPVMIIYDSNGEPLGSSLLPDSVKSISGIGPVRSA